jgi:hypothetical protein
MVEPNQAQFKLRKAMDVGTSNPILSRLTLGLYDIVQTAQISQKEKELINQANLDVMLNLVKAEKIGMSIFQSIEAVSRSLNEDGVKTQSGGKVINLPTTEGIDKIRELLKYSKKARQELIKIFNVFLKTSISNPRFDKVLVEALKVYGPNDPVTQLLRDDHDLWIKKLLTYRDEDEHPTVPELFYDFDINRDEASKDWVITLPKFHDGTRVDEFIKSSIHNILTFAEEANALLLQKAMPKGTVILEIPVEQRDKTCEKRFCLIFNPK